MRMAGTSVFLTPAEPSTHLLEAMMLAAWRWWWSPCSMCSEFPTALSSHPKGYLHAPKILEEGIACLCPLSLQKNPHMEKYFASFMNE